MENRNILFFKFCKSLILQQLILFVNANYLSPQIKGKNDGKWTDTDSNSDIDDEVSLLECAKIAKLSNNVKDNYGCRGMNEGRKQIKNTHTHSAVPVLTIDDDDDDDDEDGDEPNELDLNRDQLIPDTPGSFYCLPNEIESPAIKASVKPNNQVVRSKGEHSTEASVKSGSSSKSILMEGLSFSKDNKKVQFLQLFYPELFLS